MANLTRGSKADISGNILYAPQIVGTAGEALDAVAPCYKKASDGLIYMCNGTSANEAALVWGWTRTAKSAGEAVTLFAGPGLIAEYAASGLTIGTQLYVATTKGLLSDAATTGGKQAIAVVYSSTQIMTLASSNGKYTDATA